MEPSASAVPFDELDELLDRAYALEGAERTAFLDRLPIAQRDRLRQLLELSQALTWTKMAAGAQSALENLASPSEPSMAGGWRLLHELGSGGMGQVFLARREAPEGRVLEDHDYVQEAAVKVLWSVRAPEEVRARFLRERRLLASLNHPGLARFIDGGFMDDGRPWFAMEYVAGEAIDVHARQLSLEARLRLFMEVCSSVAHAHQRLIVHRDIKPQNLLVDETGRARLLDFGIAGVLEDIDDGVHTQTAGGPLTVQYASPEQLRGGVVTASSDIYQLGLLLYEMLAGVRPYDLGGASLMRAIEVVSERTPPRPSTHRQSVPPDLDAIVMTALAKAPDDRYRSVAAFAEDIGRFLAGLPVRAVAPTPWYLARRFLRRHALLVSIVAASGLGLAAATAISIRMANEATAQAARSRATQQILSDVFKKADPFRGNGGAVTLADALIRAKPEIAARVDQDPLLAWEVNRTLGQIYQGLGLVEEERSAFEAMLQAAHRLTRDRGDYRHLEAMAGVGNVLARTNPVEAVNYFDAHLPARPKSRSSVKAWLDAQYAYVGALGRVRESGRADAGTFAMARVMETYGIDDPRTRGRLSQLLAGVAGRAGDDEAEDRHRRDTVEYMRAANNPSALAVILNNYAIHLGRRGRYEASEAAFQEAMAIFEDADVHDPTFANLLRSYAGLLFRTGRIEEAIQATERSLSLLPGESESYARFVAELNLAQFQLVRGDAVAALEGLVRTLPRAFEAFRDDPSVPRRMLRVFAKTMAFGGAPDLAEMALGLRGERCGEEPAWPYALEALEHKKDIPPRQEIWRALAQLDGAPDSGAARASSLETFIAVYRDEVPLFFDAWDRWQVLERLRARLAEAPLPLEWETLASDLAPRRSALMRIMASGRRAELETLAATLGRSGSSTYACPRAHPPPPR